MDIKNHFFNRKSDYLKKAKTSYFQWFPSFLSDYKIKPYVDNILSDTLPHKFLETIDFKGFSRELRVCKNKNMDISWTL